MPNCQDWKASIAHHCTRAEVDPLTLPKLVAPSEEQLELNDALPLRVNELPMNSRQLTELP